MISLYTSIYLDTDVQRFEELLYTITSNLDLDSIDRLFLFDEDSIDALKKNDKLTLIPIDHRPTFSDFFKLVNHKTKKDDINIIANTDILFDENIELFERIMTRRDCFALSRWNISDNFKPILYDKNDSQDVWVFKGKVRPVISDYYMGVPRCDNRLLYELFKSGYTICNPAYSFMMKHIHKGASEPYPVENQVGYVDPPYAYMYPHNQFNFFKTIIFNLKNDKQLLPYRYDLKKMNKWLIFKLYRYIVSRILKQPVKLIGY